MGKITDLFGTFRSQFQIGIGGNGFRRLRFRNNFDGDLEWEPTAPRTIALPDDSGTIALVAARRVGVTQFYIGEFGIGQGWFDDFDGKWVYLSSNTIRTIGNSNSGANIAASWTQTLFEFFWNEYPNSICPVLTSGGANATRGVSASIDFGSDKRIRFPDYRGRVLVTCGTGASLTLRERGDAIGAETHALQIGELPAHTHSTAFVGGTAVSGTALLTSATSRGTTSPGPDTASAGSGAAHNNMQPSIVQHLIISAGAR